MALFVALRVLSTYWGWSGWQPKRRFECTRWPPERHKSAAPRRECMALSNSGTMSAGSRQYQAAFGSLPPLPSAGHRGSTKTGENPAMTSPVTPKCRIFPDFLPPKSRSKKRAKKRGPEIRKNLEKSASERQKYRIFMISEVILATENEEKSRTAKSHNLQQV